MNRADALTLITYLNRAGLVGAMEGQAAVWADALADVRFEDAQEAARWMARTRTSAQRWVTPGDIRELVTTIRDDRVMRGRVYIASPPERLDSLEHSDYLAAADHLLANGHDPKDVSARALEMVRGQVEA